MRSLPSAPPAVSEAMIKEMFRILAPNGEMVISDPPPFRGVNPMQAVVLDWDTDNRAEPFFSAAAMAGAMSGAHLGLPHLPAAWTPHLTDRGQWGAAELIALAERCYTRKHAAPT